MKVMAIIRVVENKYGTFGVLLHGVTPIALTLELPWRDNKPNESCIPEGSYYCSRVNTPKHGEVFLVKNVPDRSAILIHKGNVVEDTEGCILVGEEFGVLQGKTGILHSGDAFDEMMWRLRGVDEFKLKIRSCYA